MTTPACRNSPHSPVPERHARLSCSVAPSRILTLILAAALLQGLLLLWLAPLPWYIALALVVPVLAYAILEWHRIVSTSGVISTRERRWFWRPDGAEDGEIFLHGELVLWSWVVVVNSRDPRGRRLRLVLARDSMSADDWRRLRAALQYSR
ncbi:protein YgfX [Microbulbifer sp. YPW16]|uniref:protein YgfX n=1 Tax=Microbulbifer sp. YPW16 TaxID=2904242 RepID=UPI00351DA95C